MELEKSLGINGEYDALYGEVVTYDMYRMRDVADIVSCNDPTFVHVAGHASLINFKPDVIFDLGANVGIFSRYARTLFKDALIVSVEPNPDNCTIFRQNTADDNTILLECAIGSGNMYHISGANGAMEVYLSEGPGYSKKDLQSYKLTSIKSLMLTDLKKYIKDGDKIVMKLDIEGNETVLFNDPPSIEMFKTIDYLAFEMHYFSNDGTKSKSVLDITNKFFDILEQTHNILKDGVYFYAVKR